MEGMGRWEKGDKNPGLAEREMEWGTGWVEEEKNVGLEERVKLKIRETWEKGDRKKGASAEGEVGGSADSRNSL